MARKTKLKTAVLWGIIAVSLLAAHSFIRTGWGDDLWYTGIFITKEQRTLWGHLSWSYHNWTSRLLVELVLVPFALCGDWLWKLADTFIVLFLIGMTVRIFGVRTNRTAGVVFFSLSLFTVPVIMLNGAGWITTTANYLWPLSLGLAGMLPLRKWCDRENLPWLQGVLCGLGLLYGANVEQLAALLLGAYLTVGAYLFRRDRRLPKAYPVFVLLILFSLLFILLCPGNAIRTAAETEVWFPDYAALTLWDKIGTGMLITCQFFFTGKGCYIFFLFAAVLAVRAFSEQKNPRRFICCLPCLASAGILLMKWIYDSGVLEKGLRLSALINALCQNMRLPKTGGVDGPTAWLQCGMYLLTAAAVVAAVCALNGKSLELLLQLTILGAGFLSRVIIGFSPTVYASGERTAIFAAMALLILAMRNMQLCLQKRFPITQTAQSAPKIPSSVQ